MVWEIGEGAFHAQTEFLRNPKCFGQSCGDGHGAWSFKDSDSGVSEAPGIRRDRHKRRLVVVAIPRWVGEITIADAIRAWARPYPRRLVRSALHQTHGA
jgi:hypothetical protein